MSMWRDLLGTNRKTGTLLWFHPEGKGSPVKVIVVLFHVARGWYSLCEENGSWMEGKG